MSFIKPRPQDKLSLYRFMPDNMTIGTEEYYRNKLGDKFPDELYRYLEVKARPEYDEHDEKRLLEQIKEYRINYARLLLNELEERGQEKCDETEKESLNT